MKDITLVIMAAAVGRRYGGLKQIDSIGANGKSMFTENEGESLTALERGSTVSMNCWGFSSMVPELKIDSLHLLTGTKIIRLSVSISCSLLLMTC